MTPELYYKCYLGIIQESINTRSDPKLIAAKLNSKKDTKKDAKGNP
jgi:hypothetical protein